MEKWQQRHTKGCRSPLWQGSLKGQQLNLATTLASQPAASYSLSFITTIAVMTLGLGLFVGLAAEKLQPNLALVPTFASALTVQL